MNYSTCILMQMKHSEDFNVLVSSGSCRHLLLTDAAVGPDGVVVLLGHAGVTGEAVVCSHWFLCLCTEECGTVTG